jgi:uncharacterized OsmC-like protein
LSASWGSALAAPVQQAAPKLNTAVVTGTVVLPGRALLDARTNHWVIDSPAALGGPNQEVNPLDSLLGALSTCGMFLYEKAAQELSIPLEHISAVTEGDFAAQGMKDGSVNPRLRAFRLKLKLDGPSVAQANALRAQFKKRCPVYTTLSLAAPIDVIHVGMDDKVGALLEVNFKYNVPTADFQAAIAPLAEQFAAADGLRWKIWALDEKNSQFSGIILFDDADKRAAFLKSDLAKTVTTHPALSDFVITPYAVMGAESRVTNAPMMGAPADAKVDKPGVVLEVAYTYDFANADEYVAAVSPLAEKWTAVPGLIWKTWTLNPDTKRAGARNATARTHPGQRRGAASLSRQRSGPSRRHVSPLQRLCDHTLHGHGGRDVDHAWAGEWREVTPACY